MNIRIKNYQMTLHEAIQKVLLNTGNPDSINSVRVLINNC